MSGAIYVCIKQFNARLGDELSLKVGDRIEVLADDSEYNDGWYMGRDVVSNKVGLFPKSFTKLAVETKLDPNLLRLRSRRLPAKDIAEASPTVSAVSADSALKSIKPSNGSQNSTTDVHHTLNEIDKALQELRVLKDDGESEADRSNHAPEQKNATMDPKKGHQRNTSSISLTQDLNPLKAKEWTPKQVSLYFAIVLGFDMDVAGKFARHKITGEILFELDLAHLKELDIASFGTRFEIFKEIDRLKQISSRANGPGLDPLAEVPNANNGLRSSPPFNNLDDDNNKPANRTLLLPSVQLNAFKNSIPRNASTSFLPLSSSTEPLEGNQFEPENSPVPEIPGSFMSPRRAPEPPLQSPINRNFRFGGSPMTPQNNGLHGLYVTRTNASSAALSSANGNGLLRPASSVYDGSVMVHHRRGSSGLSNSHRRHSSVFSFLSGNAEEPFGNKEKLQSQNLYKEDPDTSRHVSTPNRFSKHYGDSDGVGESVDLDDVGLSPRKFKGDIVGEKSKDSKVENPQSRLKSLRSVSTQNFRNLTVLKKLKTSAFQEGIRDINPDDAIKTSNYSGWISKKSGSTLGWRSRYFTLHGTRLSYFTSLRDKREKGLIDITAHKVIPISTEGDQSASNDKYIALYAALTGYGRYCFKLVPPAPGFKKGLTFTQPKTHYFAVETQEDMRGWMKALMTATIDIDDSVPVVSSCNTPTVTLAKAQELLARAREETKMKDEELRAKGFIRDGDSLYDETNGLTFYNNSATSEEASPIVGSIDETTISSTTGGTGSGANGFAGSSSQPKLSVDTSGNYRVPSTPQLSNNPSGFASPYLLASGLLSPKLGNTASTSSTPYIVQKKDYFDVGNSTSDLARPPTIDETPTSQKPAVNTSPKQMFSNSSGRVMSGSKKKEKLMAYTNEGSFVIKQKK